MDLTFRVPMQCCSLQHQTLLLSPVTSTTGYCFCFGSFSSFFLELFLPSSPVAYWVGTYRPGKFIFQCHIFLPYHTLYGVLVARILEWVLTLPDPEPSDGGQPQFSRTASGCLSLRKRNSLWVLSSEDSGGRGGCLHGVCVVGLL